MYGPSVEVYDAIYGSKKDYEADARSLDALIRARVPSPSTLLDVACGTGLHLERLAPKGYRCEGLEIVPRFAAIARERNPDTVVHEGDMRDFELPGRFDAVTCLFSAIGYVRSTDELDAAVAAMAKHLAPGGVLIVESWLMPEQYQAGRVHALQVESEGRTIVRMNTSLRRGRFSVMDMHHLVGTTQGVQHFVERHELFLATDAEYRAAFTRAGLTVEAELEGLIGRPLYLGQRG